MFSIGMVCLARSNDFYKNFNQASNNAPAGEFPGIDDQLKAIY
jgi:hypothetical protein